MNTTPPSTAESSPLARLRASGHLKSLLWLINGCLLGGLVLTLADRQAERRRQQAAARATTEACDRLVARLDQRLVAAAVLQEELRAELMRANTAATPQEMHPGRFRLALRRLKSQLEGAEKEIRQYMEEAARIASRQKVRHGAELLDASRRQAVEEKTFQLDQSWQELTALEQHADWLSLRWAQFLEQEANVARQTQAQQSQEVEKLQKETQAEMRRMAEALTRAHEQAERARWEARQEAGLQQVKSRLDQPPAPAATTVVNVNTPAFPDATWPCDLWPYETYFPAPLPAPVFQAPYYSVPSYYDYGRWSRSRIIGYGCRYPRTVRIGPYLVVN